MSFYERLERETASERAHLVSNPLFAAALEGRVTLPMYRAFLQEAWHHVRHTVPLMMACGARLGPGYEWLLGKLVHYVEEEFGHEEWILDDIAASGGDPDATRISRPAAPTELMVAYAYDTVNRGNPVGFFGMVHVLEGTSIALATRAACGIATALSLPANAVTYLGSHGALDQMHVGFFRQLVDRIDNERDRVAIIHAARMFYRLYGDIFRHLHQEYFPCNSLEAVSS